MLYFHANKTAKLTLAHSTRFQHAQPTPNPLGKSAGGVEAAEATPAGKSGTRDMK
jgi:hypothetical protein